jgi:uncharacterized Zn-finger protein
VTQIPSSLGGHGRLPYEQVAESQVHSLEFCIRDCAICKRQFSNYSAYESHMKYHQENKGYECGNCGQTFVHKFSWRRHCKIHTGAKPYKCQFCGMPFRESHHVQAHIMNKHREMVFCKNDLQESLEPTS